MKLDVNDNVLKAHIKNDKGDFVVYDIDYLLNNLTREVYLLEKYRQDRKNVINTKEELKKIREIVWGTE